VNDSIAPNEYIVLRNVVLPGRRTAIETKPAKTTSDSHGVLNFGWRRRNAAGSCRYPAIAYVMRDAPMTPAFVAMKRIVAASIPTYTFRTESNAPWMPRCSTRPSTGSLAKPPFSGPRPSTVW